MISLTITPYDLTWCYQDNMVAVATVQRVRKREKSMNTLNYSYLKYKHHKILAKIVKNWDLPPVDEDLSQFFFSSVDDETLKRSSTHPMTLKKVWVWSCLCTCVIHLGTFLSHSLETTTATIYQYIVLWTALRWPNTELGHLKHGSESFMTPFRIGQFFSLFSWRDDLTLMDTYRHMMTITQLVNIHDWIFSNFSSTSTSWMLKRHNFLSQRQVFPCYLIN